MRKRLLHLLDSDAAYAGRLMNYVNRSKDTPYEMRAFTDPGTYAAARSGRRAEALLVAEADLPAVHTDDMERLIVLGEEDADGRKEGPARIRKYQPAPLLMRELYILLKEPAGEGSAFEPAALKPPLRVIGIASPIGRCGKTTFALALARELRKKRSVLFMSLDYCSGLETLAGLHFESRFEDLAYCLLREGEGLSARMQPLFGDYAGIRILPPASDGRVFRQLDLSDWQRLFDSLRTRSQFEILVLDLGGMALSEPALLEECDRIYMPVQTDPSSLAKEKEYEALLSREYEDLLPEIVRLSPKELQGTEAPGKDFFTVGIPDGRLAGAVRRIIERDGLWD